MGFDPPREECVHGKDESSVLRPSKGAVRWKEDVFLSCNAQSFNVEWDSSEKDIPCILAIKC